MSAQSAQRTPENSDQNAKKFDTAEEYALWVLVERLAADRLCTETARAAARAPLVHPAALSASAVAADADVPGRHEIKQDHQSETGSLQ